MKILLAQINPIVGDLTGNTEKILQGIAEAKKRSATLVVFPELCLSGYPPDDFLLLPHFVDALNNHLKAIKEASVGLGVIVGTPRRTSKATGQPLHNSAAIFYDGNLVGYQDKSLLPTYDVFDERRYFEPADTINIWNLCGKKVALTICEDIWEHSDLLKYTKYARDPILELHSQQPDLLINISASPYSHENTQYRITACSKAAKTLTCPVLLCNQVGGNDGIIFDGQSIYVDKHGNLQQCGKAFEEDYLLVDLTESYAPFHRKENPIEDLYKALILGLRDYFKKLGFSKACLGLSGGIDSALVACLAVEALGRENVLAVLMPSRFSSKDSVEEARRLSETLGIAHELISIEGPFQSYLDLLKPIFDDKPFDVTEENLQARIRGMILMAISNKLGYIVLSTGNKSELAMGYSTLYGDMCGGLGVISDVSKRQVYALSRWINRDREIIPWSTIQKAPSAELRPNQKDSDTLPDYEIIDSVLGAYVEEHQSPQEIASRFHYPLDLVNDLIHRIHQNEYKRRQSPPGLRVTEKAFSVGRRFPIVQKFTVK